MNINPQQGPEQDIARVLNGLRHATPPSGLEDRITHRLRSAASAQPASPSLFTTFRNTMRVFPFSITDACVKARHRFLAPATRYALAATALAILSLIIVHHPHNQSATSVKPDGSLNPIILSKAIAPLAAAQSQAPDPPVRVTTIRTLSIENHPAPSCDCDASALAETLAPSHPAPPMPLTPQELRLVLATRPGAPIEVAELDQLREPILRAAERAQEHSNLRQYVHGLLAPLAAADALEPTSISPTNEAQPSTEPTSSTQP